MAGIDAGSAVGCRRTGEVSRFTGEVIQKQEEKGKTFSVLASSATMALPMGCVAPVTTQTKPYNLPSAR